MAPSMNASTTAHRLVAEIAGAQPVPCKTSSCSASNLCCGEGSSGEYFCASNCNCFKVAGTVTCPCNDGWRGNNCTQQVSPTVWLAIILTVGTMLILFIAWGFRCRQESDEEPGHAGPRTNNDPLLREAPERAAQAAVNPVSARGTTTTNTLNSDEAASEPIRRCVVCLSKPPQVVMIPCGHACTCRKCSRQLDKCPLCRLDIQACQRFYLS